MAFCAQVMASLPTAQAQALTVAALNGMATVTELWAPSWLKWPATAL